MFNKKSIVSRLKKELISIILFLSLINIFILTGITFLNLPSLFEDISKPVFQNYFWIGVSFIASNTFFVVMSWYLHLFAFVKPFGENLRKSKIVQVLIIIFVALNVAYIWFHFYSVK